MSDQPPLLRSTRRSLPIALLRARETVMGPIRDMLAPSGVNEQKWRVLRVLQEQGPLELSMLAQAACLIPSSLTRMVPPMMTEGLVLRQSSPDDRRKVIIAVTDRGQELIRSHAAESAAILARIERQFGTDRLNSLLDLLDDLHRLDLRTPPNP